MDERTYSSAEVCQLLGWTYRQLDYRSAQLVGRPGSGIPRRFTEEQLGRLRVIAFAQREIETARAVIAEAVMVA